MASGWYGSVSGGHGNTGNHDHANVSGGSVNTANQDGASVSGGEGCVESNVNGWQVGYQGGGCDPTRVNN